MKLILIRHGDAGAYTLPDELRQLSEMGQKQAQQTGLWLKQNSQPNQWISSPYLRARQTMQVLQTVCESQQSVDIVANITPDDDARTAIAALDAHLGEFDGVAVVVCHMNVIAHMTALLTGTAAQPFSLAQACVLEGECGVGLMWRVATFCPEI